MWGHNLTFTEKGWKFQISFLRAKSLDTIGTSQFQSIRVQTRVLGKHQLYSLLAAAAVGMQEKISTTTIQEALEAFETPPGRGRLIAGQKDISIIDETYNASPESMKQGLDMLEEMRRPDRRSVAILGTMNELGGVTKEIHTEVARYAARKVDFLVFVGPFGEDMAKEVQMAGHPINQVMSFLNV